MKTSQITRLTKETGHLTAICVCCILCCACYSLTMPGKHQHNEDVIKDEPKQNLIDNSYTSTARQVYCRWSVCDY